MRHAVNAVAFPPENAGHTCPGAFVEKRLHTCPPRLFGGPKADNERTSWRPLAPTALALPAIAPEFPAAREETKRAAGFPLRTIGG